MRTPLAAIVALPFAVAPAFASDVYIVDKARSEAKFEVSTFYSNITGRMRDIGGVINFGPASPGGSSGKIQIRANSGDTGAAALKQQLRSSSFLYSPQVSPNTLPST